MAKVLDAPPWWGYSKEHGWVVLDRTLHSNKSGLIADFFFCRCNDSSTYIDKRSKWVAPHYVYASIYISSLPPSESEAAAADFQLLKARWPEFHDVIAKEYKEWEDELLQREHDRVAVEGNRKIVKARR
ncbi:MAG: hypothetical protein DM484_04425 [Candidatus Methylumidiphilus alinenensis]|uniref:Uncharacterized protein n=1 Tax=Candidatus Methylumidiphilus alinenensis TaxID=2202197 RepID=A0A2W4T829_9GAMM|nr:MAG: hypothetical protein DM484_04425 [Candidatus Methylumidiphilus alinenensis]